MSTLALTSVVHLVRPTGVVANDLEELRAGIATAPNEALFLHVPLVRLRAGGDDAPQDDFSDWVFGVVQDRETAERLAFAAQTAAGSAADLRAALLAVLDAHAPATRAARRAPAGGGFHFLAAESVRLDTGLFAEDPEVLLRLLTVADTSAWFYHLVEQPWRADGTETLCGWLRARGAATVAARIEEVVGSGLPLEAVRSRLIRRWRRGRLVQRLSEASQRPETVQRVLARAAAAGLARRLARGDAG